ncbi:hypothetical protein LMG28614_04490 [Paraburkholderia ultramafica]|uniref:DUF3562 domain-containing protein n=1 Tax=Paraburkholderia ultramafica TaxID=1544867 RepID=A0A6S7D606_9BURK|nr:DUF3562 domain-containing protein [Paraburkholderia ultramafica]CAB3797058.1 hypothetical protein LMG28614_04490 [Paraburkholderia ultramafica]
MTTQNPVEVVHEIAASTNTAEETVSKMYAETLEAYKKDARILDYVPLLAAKRVRETLRAASQTVR